MMSMLGQNLWIATAFLLSSPSSAMTVIVG
jgi:hypothetical protein